MTFSMTRIGALAYLALVLLVPAAGCSFAADGGLDLADPNVPESRGQMILFVGTNPETLDSDLYLAQALDSGNPNRTADEGPDILEAEEFQIENLTSNLALVMPSFESDGLELFGAAAPFPVPDRTGSLVALLASGRVGGPSEGSGRIYLLDLERREFQESVLIPGLRAVHFTWSGGFLILEHVIDGEPARSVTSLLPTLSLGTKLSSALDDEDSDVHFVGLERSSNRLLLGVSNSSGETSDIVVLDPELGEVINLTEDLDAAVSDASLSPDGSHLAVTVTDSLDGSRSIFTFPLEGGPAAGMSLGQDENEECFWPVWQPITEAAEASSLACVCLDSGSSRPDIVRWFPGQDIEADTLTSGPQPELFDGTMSGLTLRSRPQWDPSGAVIVFGASTQEEAIEGEAMSLVALPLDESSAYPIFTADEGSSGWAHFSSALTKPHLLVWDRSETGLLDSQGDHPIQVVVVDEPGRAPHPVALGQDLFVAYPQYLGANTMLYP